MWILYIYFNIYHILIYDTKTNICNPWHWKAFGFVQVCVSQLMGNTPFGSSLQRGNLPRPFLQGLGTLGMLRRIVEKEGQESKVSKVWNGEVMTGLVGVGTFPVGFGTLYTGLGYNIARGSWTATGWNSWRKHGFSPPKHRLQLRGVVHQSCHPKYNFSILVCIWLPWIRCD